MVSTVCKWCGRSMAGRRGPCPQRRRFAPCERPVERASVGPMCVTCGKRAPRAGCKMCTVCRMERAVSLNEGEDAVPHRFLDPAYVDDDGKLICDQPLHPIERAAVDLKVRREMAGDG